jgi:signal transduction histidine kinase
LKLEPIDEFGSALESFTFKDGLSADYAESILEDREGSIWIGTQEGLDQFRNSTLVPVTLSRSSNGFSLAADDNGYVWVADSSAQVYRLHDGMENIERNAFPGTAVYRDPRGSIWLSNPEQICHVEHQRCIGNGLPASKTSPYFDPIRIAADISGRLWAYVHKQGLFYLQDGSWHGYETPAELSGLAPSTEFTEATGRIWFGFAEEKFASLDNGSIRVYTAADGLRVGVVEAIFPAGGHLWVGGSRGLALLENNKIRSITPSDQESFADVSGVIETEDGNLWLNESRGISHVVAPELSRLLSEHASSVRYERFDSLDGLPGYTPQSSTFPTALQGTDGRLWFTTTRGVAWLDPTRLSNNTIAPPVVIESVIADGKHYDQSNHLQLPAGTSKLQFTYAGLSLVVPERVRYRYQLEGLDRDWQSSSVPGVAYYTNLSPGDYKFRVIAANNDGLWNTTGASLNFSVLPAFYQTKWFYALCALCCAALLAGMYRIRIRQVSAQVRGRLEERLAERERIARELHDTLLQGVQGLVLRFQAAADRLPPQEPVRTQLEAALERADQVLSEGRDAVKSLRGSNGDEAELTQALAATGKQLAQAHLGQFRASVEGAPRELHPIVREEALRIAREALTNAFQHAKAELVEVEVSYAEAELHVRVRDDGQGMNDDVLRTGRPGHWGLLGMQERAKKIRANLTLWSKPGAGTEIDLRVPSRVAYRSSSSRRFFWR